MNIIKEERTSILFPRMLKVYSGTRLRAIIIKLHETTRAFHFELMKRTHLEVKPCINVEGFRCTSLHYTVNFLLAYLKTAVQSSAHEAFRMAIVSILLNVHASSALENVVAEKALDETSRIYDFCLKFSQQ